MLGTVKCNDIKNKIMAAIYYNKSGPSQNVLFCIVLFCIFEL